MIEEQIAKSIFTGQTEKSFLDKLLAKEDIQAVREIIKKPRLTRSELLELLYLLSSGESKLVNYDERERYIILKFFVWIREFIKIAELLYDYNDFLENKGYKLNERTKQYLDNAQRLVEHNIKFLVDLYFNISRTTLSIGATGFLEALKNKFEISYPEQRGLYTPVEQKKKFWESK